MGLFSKKNQKTQSTPAPKPIAGPTPLPSVGPTPPSHPAPAPGTPKVPVAPSFGPSAPIPSGPTPPPSVGGFKPMNNGPTFSSPTPSSPSFGNNPSTSIPNFGVSGPNANEEVPQRKFDIFNENLRYVNFDFSKLKIDKLDLTTNPEPRQIRKHIKKLLELQKQLINMEKDLVCRRDFIDKYIFEEKENQKPKVLVDLLSGKTPEEIEKEKLAEANETKVEETKVEEVKTKKEAKKDIAKKDEKIVSKDRENKELKETKNTKTSSDDDIFKSVEAMLNSK